jgi:hypothetical protein
MSHHDGKVQTRPVDGVSLNELQDTSPHGIECHQFIQAEPHNNEELPSLVGSVSL